MFEFRPCVGLLLSMQQIMLAIMLAPAQAKEAYKKAFEIEPDDAVLASAMHKAEVAEHKAMEHRKHKFRSGSSSSVSAKRAKIQAHDVLSDRTDCSGVPRGRSSGQSKGSRPSQAALLSFGEEDDE